MRTRKYFIPDEDLAAARNGIESYRSIAARHGCEVTTIRRLLGLKTNNQTGDDLLAGKSGDRGFDALMGERRFEDHPGLRSGPGMPPLWPHGYSRNSLTGSSAAWAPV